MPRLITDLLILLAISDVDFWGFDTHSGAAEPTFPHIGKYRRGDRVISNFDKMTRSNVRR